MADQFTKKPGSVLDYAIDWTSWLNGDTISTASWTAPAGIYINSSTKTSTVATVWMSGGSAGTEYKLTNTIVTSAGRTEQRDLFITVLDLSILTPRTFWYLVNELGERLHNSTGSLFSTAQLKRFVNGAQSYWDASGGYIIAIDQSMRIVANQHTYNLPTAITNLRQVLRILKRTSVTADLSTVDLSTGYSHYSDQVIQETWKDITNFMLTQNGTQVKLLLRQPFATTDVVAIVYKAPHNALVNDTDTTDVSPEFIYAYGRYLAHNELCSSPSQTDRKLHQDERDAALRDAKMILEVALRTTTLDPYVQRGFPLVADW